MFHATVEGALNVLRVCPALPIIGRELRRGGGGVGGKLMSSAQKYAGV
jgi:hypothetical protein